MTIISPPPGNVIDFNQTWRNWFARLYKKVNQSHRGCLVTRDNNQSIPNATSTTVIFDTANATEVYDTDGIHDLVTNPTRLTVPAGVSKVKVVGVMYFDANITGYRRAKITKSGLDFPGQPFVQIPVNSAVATAVVAHLTSNVLEVTAGEYFELVVLQNSGSALNYVGDSNLSWFAMEIIE